jgi:hypothetical protein
MLSKKHHANLPIVSLEGQTSYYRWLPVSYLILFGGVILVCLWAEANRQPAITKVQSDCPCATVSPSSITAAGCVPARSMFSKQRSEGVNKPVSIP